MKRTLCFLAALALSLTVGCAREDGAAGTDTTSNKPIANESPIDAGGAEEEGAAPAWEDEGFGFVFSEGESWRWQAYETVYRDGYYDPDRFSAFKAQNAAWYRDTDMMESWEEARAPFGDRIDANHAADTPFRTQPDRYHALTLYKTFEIDDLTRDFALYMFYDNTVYCYVNGEPYFIRDGQGAGKDWSDGFERVACNQGERSLADFLRQGENYIAVSVCDSWGGREFDAYMTREGAAVRERTVLAARGGTWRYRVFKAIYKDGNGQLEGSAPGGRYEQDAMAEYLAAHPDFATDTAEMETWSEGRAPMSAGAANWTGMRHGLIVYQTFAADDLAALRTADDFVMFGSYDNAVHVYLNGVEIYTDDDGCAGHDYKTDARWSLDADLVKAALREGGNILVATVKDAWGGREFDCGLEALWW